MTEINEVNMKEFFQSVVDHVATLSSQAAQVEGLKQRIEEISQRVYALESENADLKRSLFEARQQVSDRETDLQRVTEEFHNSQQHSVSLRDTIVQRDGRVMELESSLSAERASHEATTRERDEARNTSNDLTALVGELRREVSDQRDSASHWRQRFEEMEKEASSYRAQFERIQSILNPPRPVEQTFNVA